MHGYLINNDGETSVYLPTRPARVIVKLDANLPRGEAENVEWIQVTYCHYSEELVGTATAYDDFYDEDA